MQRSPKEYGRAKISSICDKYAPESDTIKCHLNYNPRFVNIKKCVTHCFEPCSKFLNMEHITEKCQTDGCSSQYPCSVCMEEIAATKFYIKLLKVADKSAGVRFKRMVSKRDKNKERLDASRNSKRESMRENF